MRSRDVLLVGATQDARYAALFDWADQSVRDGELPEGLRTMDFHRLQVERWVWQHKDTVGPVIVDVGVEHARRYFGPGYVTCGLHDEDVKGDLCEGLPFAHDSVDAVILTEMLEHVEDPVAAVAETWRVVKPGGCVLITVPMMWPWHGRTPETAAETGNTHVFPDYWRFTDQGVRRLLRHWEAVDVRAIDWTVEGAQLYDLLRRFEIFGHRAYTHAHTGYTADAVKPQRGES